MKPIESLHVTVFQTVFSNLRQIANVKKQTFNGKVALVSLEGIVF